MKKVGIFLIVQLPVRGGEHCRAESERRGGGPAPRDPLAGPPLHRAGRPRRVPMWRGSGGQ